MAHLGTTAPRPGFRERLGRSLPNSNRVTMLASPCTKLSDRDHREEPSMRKSSSPGLSLKLTTLFCVVAFIITVPTLVLAQTQNTVSINAGGSATGSFGADQFFSGGSTFTNTATIDMSQI